MFYRSWHINEIDENISNEISNSFNVDKMVSDILVSRGYNTVELANDILLQNKQLPNPMHMLGMQEAVQRILSAIENDERIVIFGDYDVDGVTATALLYSHLESLGAEVYYKLPSRSDDGYGLSPQLVKDLANKKVDLIITVDNGICEHEAVEQANELGIDVIITDHHLAPEKLPNAVAVVNPQQPNDKNEYKILSGVGVAFMLAVCLEGCTPEELLPVYADLAAIGTVADIMPLIGINRKIVKEGLLHLQNTQRPGLLALMENCGLTDKQLQVENISFAISPRLNAAGRMDNATEALELLLCDDYEQAQAKVLQLQEQNAARQKEEQDILSDVLQKINDDENYKKERIIVVSEKNYHQGVIGIVASRVTEVHGKPAIIISVDENGEGKGSGRSTAGISLYNGILACEDLLLRFGGHALAAGLSIAKENIDTFRNKINKWALMEYPTIKYPKLQLDIEVNICAVTQEKLEQVSKLAPFGQKNPAPLFLIKSGIIDAIYPISEGKHSRLKIKQKSDVFYAVYFGKNSKTLPYNIGDTVDLAVSLSNYEGKNGSVISGRIKDIRPAGLKEEHLVQIALFDALCCDAPLNEEQKQILKPTRQDSVDVYRQLQSDINTSDLRVLFAKLGEKRTGKILTSLHAFLELGLAQIIQKDDAEYYTISQNTEKKDLQSAPIMLKLN